MLWHKVLLETRWRFIIGLALLMCSAAATALTYPRVAALLPMLGSAGSMSTLRRGASNSMLTARPVFRSSLISDFDGTPANTYGTYVRNHYLGGP